MNEVAESNQFSVDMLLHKQNVTVCQHNAQTTRDDVYTTTRYNNKIKDA